MPLRITHCRALAVKVHRHFYSRHRARAQPRPLRGQPRPPRGFPARPPRRTREGIGRRELLLVLEDTLSSRRRVDGVEVDATIQHERAVKF